MTDDLATLRARALWYQEQGWLTHTVKIEDYLALLDRLERAEAAIERAKAEAEKVSREQLVMPPEALILADATLAALDTGKEAGE